MSTLLYKNKSIHYSDSGKGRPVVFLHGFLMNLNTWKLVTIHLEKKFRIIAIDLPGHGKTDSFEEVHSMDFMADIVNAVLKHLKIENLIIVGHSMGGYVALAFAAKHLNKLDAICLVNSTAVNDSEEKKIIRDRAIHLVRQNKSSFVRVFISNLFRPKNRRIFSEEIKVIKREALEMDEDAIIAALIGMKTRPDRLGFFQNLSVEKLMIIGKKDPVLKYDALSSQSQNGNITLKVLPDGHMSHIENMKDFTYFILHFIEKI